ncbi:MAG: restriction endonuclease, partial [Clostridia bacterium]|nr:restriction endonuclease [Clostridia bacterium]
DEDKTISYVEQETNVEKIVTGLQRDEKIQNRILELLQSKPMTKQELFDDISNLLQQYNLHQTAVRADTGRILSVLVKDDIISLNDNTYSINTEELDIEEENKKRLMKISDEELVYHTVLMLERYYKERNSHCSITAKNTDGSGDNGIDGIISIEDDLGIDEIILQVKNKQEKAKTIPQRQIKEFAGTLALDKAKHGIFITSAKYTADTKKYAREFSERVKRLDLIDGEKWLQLAEKIGYSISGKLE